MQIHLSQRVDECQARIVELTQEMQDYQGIMACIGALQAVTRSPTKYPMTDYQKVVTKLEHLCARHEIRIPSEGPDWESIEVV